MNGQDYDMELAARPLLSDRAGRHWMRDWRWQ